MGSRSASRRRGGGLSPVSGQEAAAAAARQPPPPPVPAGMPAPIGEVLPWLCISVACFAAFLYLPGRVSGPRARVTLIGGNEFLNVASHLHFCVWIWLVHDWILRLLAVLLFPPRRAAVYFHSMFLTPDGSSGGAAGQLLRMVRSLLVQPAPGDLDLVPEDFKPTDYKNLGDVPRGSTYWGYRKVALLSYAALFLFWMLVTWHYHTKHVLRESRQTAERKKQSAKRKREDREKLLERLKRGEDVPQKEIAEAERANLAADEFSDDDVDYDPYGRPVPEPPFVPTVSWMVLWSAAFSGAFVWVQAMPIMMSQLFPVAVCGVLAYCVLCPQ